MKIWQRMALALATGGAIYAVCSEPGSQNFGPLHCDHCRLGMPEPDLVTFQTLMEFYEKDFGGIFGIGERYEIEPGDKVTVCNITYCVDYTLSQDTKWLGSNMQRQKSGLSGKLDTIKRLPPEVAADVLREQVREPTRGGPRGASGLWPVERGSTGRVTVGSAESTK